MKLVKLETDRGTVYVNPEYVVKVEAPNNGWTLVYLHRDVHPLSVPTSSHPTVKILRYLASDVESP